MRKFLYVLLAVLLLQCFTNDSFGGDAINMQSGTITITRPINFYDGGGQGTNYANNQQDTLTIYPPSSCPGSKICVTFHKFNTQTNVDYLRIYDGNSISATQLNELSGPGIYGTIKSSASDGSLTFLFSSNNITNSEGWWATITTDTLPEDITMISNGVWYSNGGRFFDSGGPNYNYEPGAQTITTIYPKNAGDKVSAILHECNIAGGDILQIYNGNNTSPANLLGTINGTSTYNYGTITSSATDGSLTFYFQSDNNTSSVAAGWNASIVVNYSPEDITTLANGTFTVSKGRFFDAGGSYQNYPVSPNQIVTTTLLPKNAGEKVCVTFHESDIASGDFLEVYDAATASGNPIAILTGINTGTIKASNSTGALTFRFMTNASGSAEGWIASITNYENPEEITMLANQTFTVNCYARFYDNGGHFSNYGDNKLITTTLFPSDPSDKLNTTFHAFNTVVNDVLYVYDGPDTNASLIGSYSGNLNTFSVNSTHSTGSLTFKFVSTSSGNNYGWYASVNCNASLPSLNMPYNTFREDTISTGAYFYDNSGANANYSDNSGLNSILTFRPANSSEKISVTFNFFQTHSSNDYLDIYDGSTTTATLIARLYNNAGYGTITASNTSGCLTFRFVSDIGSTQGGWAAYVSTNANPQVISMPGTFITNTGFFIDPGGNLGNYTDAVNHITTISPVNGQGKICLSFAFLNTHSLNDYLIIHDGMSITDSIIAVLNVNAGYGSVSASTVNASGSLTIEFVTDNGSVGAGWAAVISNSTATEVVALPGTYTLSKGVYYDQGGPFANYTDNTSSFTVLQPANAGEKISIRFNLFNMHSNNDYIEIHDGPSVTDPVITKLGADKGYGTVTSSHPTGSLTIYSYSDNSSNSNGWTGIIWSSTSPDPKIISMPGTYITNTGFIMDNGGPDLNYNDNNNSVITVKPQTAGVKTNVVFNYFTTHSINDSIQIFNGNGVNDPLIATLKVNTADTLFTSTAIDGSLTFRFKSDGGSNAEGWMATIISDPCYNIVGINDMPSLFNKIGVYPNPASDKITIEIADYNGDDYSGQLMDISGKVLQQFNIISQVQTISLNYPPGMYLIKLASDNGFTVSKIIIN